MDRHPDVLDQATSLAQEEVNSQIMHIRRKAALMPDGEPGECSLCETDSLRLVNGVCAPCRDRYKLK